MIGKFFSRLNYYSDIPFKFFLLGSKGKVLAKSAAEMENLGRSQIFSNVTYSQKIYYTQIQRPKYLGFGFLLSFLPGTEAFTARKDYFLSLLELHDLTVERLEENDQDIYFAPHADRIALSPFFFLYGFAHRYHEITRTIPRNISININDSLLDLLSYLPLVSDVILYDSHYEWASINENWYADLLHSLLNPARLLSALLRFAHRSVDTFFELGTTYKEASLPRKILKGLSAAIFIPLRLAAGVIEKTIDLVLNTLDTLLLDPLRFGYDAIKQLITDFNKKYLYEKTDTHKNIVSMNYALFRNHRNVGNKNVIESTHHSLAKATSEQIKYYREDKRFYKMIQDREEFSTRDDFFKNHELLTNLHTQFETCKTVSPKLLMFGAFAKKNGIPTDIQNLVKQKLTDVCQQQNHASNRMSI